MVAVKILFIGLAAVLSACSNTPDYYAATDVLGNHYPVACQKDLSYIKIPVVPVSRADMDRLAAARHINGRLYGLTWGGKVIMIDENLRGWVRDDIIHHERCHVVAGDWHPYSRGRVAY